MMRAALAVAIPLLTLASWAGYRAIVANSGQLIELPIIGYDPRDLLSGHYLTYQIDYGTPVCPDPTAVADRCVCFTVPKTGKASVQWQGECGLRPDCGAWIEGTCENGRFTAGVERFYFSEAYTGALAVVPPEATALLRLNGFGAGQVQALKVEGKPLDQWLKEHQQTP